ncbi:MAG: thioredoxin domain-containing protein, partial [Chloroflexota bacterium]
MATPLSITDHSFDAQVLKCDIPVLADFEAAWNSSTKKNAPHLSEIAAEYEGRLKIVRLDIDANMTVAQTYSVFNLPTMILFKNGQ